MKNKERIKQLANELVELRKQNYAMANIIDMLIDCNATHWHANGAIANMTTMRKIMCRNLDPEPYQSYTDVPDSILPSH